MLSNKKLFLFDIDGTVCQGERLIDGTMQFLEDIRQSGGQFVHKEHSGLYSEVSEARN